MPSTSRGLVSLAIGTATVAVVLELADIWVTARLPPSPYTPLPFAPEDVAGTAFPVFGAILVFSRPRLVIGWLLCAGGLAAAVNILSANTARLLGDHPGAWPVVGASWNACTLALGVLLPLLYPTGTLPSRRWAWVVVLAPASVAADWTGRLMGDQAIREWAQAAGSAAMTAALVSLAVRFARSGPVERRQLRWLLVTLPGLIVPWVVGDPVWWLASFTIPLIPAAIAVSVLRHRLFGIETLISRALVGIGLAIAVGGVYVAVTAASSVFLSAVDRFAGLLTALLAGLFFFPARRWVQRGVDRLLYGSTGDPATLAARLRRRLREADPGHGLQAALDVLREGLAVTGVSVTAGDTVVSSGLPGSVGREMALVWHGATVGTLLIGPPERRGFPAAHDERVIATLTPYVAEAAHAVHLTAALQASRERILGAREEERRRLRRDLHDGLGQSLGGMAMAVNAAMLTMRAAPDRAELLLAEVRAGMDAVGADIRELVYGLRPPALDELGLAGAVAGLAGEPVTVSGDLSGLPAAVEVAAYRIVQEALTNARRHACASKVSVRIDRAASLRVTVVDDGLGIRPGAPAGVGLASMRERAAELGGTCTVRPARGGGTEVVADLPCPGQETGQQAGQQEAGFRKARQPGAGAARAEPDRVELSQ
ncbi:sensor histidine kinase [Nonomuraea mangrovi]|uniref:histidine kinase n=1 Tax=Nonomuraea mangrovi TaxID=2316207 RepID=A0ABW4TAK7_9ACTN